MIDEINFLQMVVLICCWVFKAVLLWKNIDTEHWYFSIFQILILIEYFIDWILMRVNFFQKHLFLHQLTMEVSIDGGRTRCHFFLYQKLKEILTRYSRTILTSSKNWLISKIWRVRLKNWARHANFKFEG